MSDADAGIQVAEEKDRLEADRKKALKREASKQQLIEAVTAARFDKKQHRVAWILDQFPDARNSDIALYIRYWQTFQPEIADGDLIRLQDLYALERPTSLTRSRAYIQNTFKLYQAEEEVQRRRRVLDDAERDRAREALPPPLALNIWADESGKNDEYLIVGSVWFIHPALIPATIRRMQAVRERLKARELHFVDINAQNLDRYVEVVGAVREPGLSFKALAIRRRGHRDVDAVLEELFFHTVALGAEHENASGRAPFPRTVNLVKDTDREQGVDDRILMNLKGRLQDAGNGRFNGQLRVGRVVAEDSKADELLQLADLFTGSLNRVMNGAGRDGHHPKDEFARRFLDAIGIPNGLQDEQQIGDKAVLLEI